MYHYNPLLENNPLYIPHSDKNVMGISKATGYSPHLVVNNNPINRTVTQQNVQSAFGRNKSVFSTIQPKGVFQGVRGVGRTRGAVQGATAVMSPIKQNFGGLARRLVKKG